jgi:glutamyl-tRNA reductase
MLYRNNLKNREFGKEAAPNFCPERATIAERQGASEDKNFAAKPTLPKTDYSGCYGMPIGCLLKIGVIGLNHKTADLECREAMAKGAAALAGEKALFFPHPTVLLSTCNRTEIYFGGDDLAEVHSDLLATLRRQIPQSFEHRLYSYFGIDCFVHLVRVTSGLDSAIVAETEIQRQVKVAYAKAVEFCALSSCMHYVFQKALKLGKFIRNRFEADRTDAPHLFHAIWTLAKELRKRRILLVGNSEINRKAARFLCQRGIRSFTLSTQNPSAVAIPGCRATGREELEHWQEYDLIICAAASDRYLLSGQGQGQLIFDVSVPRNVDPDIRGVTLYNIEALNRWIEERRALQFDKVEESLELLRQETIRAAQRYREKTVRCAASFGKGNRNCSLA